MAGQAARRREGLSTNRGPDAASDPDVLKDLKDFLNQIGPGDDLSPDERGTYSPKPDRTQNTVNASVIDRPVAHRGFGALATFGIFFCIALVLIAAATWALLARELAAERRGLDARASELTARAFALGSPLACLLGDPGESVAASCEDALFSTPQTTAAAVAYITAQLTILARRLENRPGDEVNGEQAWSDLRDAVEIDRFGIVAHVLSVRYGCTPDHCRPFAWMHNTGRIKANLSQQTYESHVTLHSADWRAASKPATVVPTVVTPEVKHSDAANGRPSTRLSFPPSASIPAVSIIEPESPPASARKK